MKALKIVIILLVLGGIAGGAYAYFFRKNSNSQSTFRTSPARKGELVVTISATGVVQAEEAIDVGAQVAGRIVSFGTDAAGKPVDYRSEVKKNMTLATIDDVVYATEVEQATAQVAQANGKLAEARAATARANADLNQLKAKLFQAENDWKRAQKLGPSEALAQSAYDAYNAAYLTAKANVDVGETAITQTKAAEDSALAAIASAEAVLKRARNNLSYCTIKSPVDGVIIDRRVGIGQTVVASLNAPSLFLIAKDLKRMQVWFAVNEADIGSIFPGQKVTFTCDAFGGESFSGQVNKVRLNAAFTQNVVTYTVEVTTDNSSGRLLPYLTANALFEVTRREDVLMVPNGALRFAPSRAEDVVPDARDAASRPGGERSGQRSGTRPSSRPVGSAGGSYRPGTVYIKDGKLLRPVRVMAGISDGVYTEIKSSALNEQSEVVVAEIRPAGTAAGAGASPFSAPMMRGRGSGGGGAGGGAGAGGGRP